jgi:hypothetical protein
MNDDQITKLLHSMRDDPIPGDSLARVRQGVAARTLGRDRGRTFGTIWRLAIPVALAGCIAAILLRPVRPTAPTPVRPEAAVEQPALVVPQGRKMVLPQPAPEPHQLAHATARPARHFQRRPPSAPQEAGASLIRIETPDPDVVILLLADGAAGDSAAHVYATQKRN